MGLDIDLSNPVKVTNLTVGGMTVIADVRLGDNAIGDVVLAKVKLDRRTEEVQAALAPLHDLLLKVVKEQVEQVANNSHRPVRITA